MSACRIHLLKDDVEAYASQGDTGNIGGFEGGGQQALVIVESVGQGDEEIESEVNMRYMGHVAGTPEHAHAAAQIPNKSTRVQMAAKYELISIQRTCESPEKIFEIDAGYGAGRISFRKSNDDWFACGEEGMRFADERCEVIDGLRWEPASSAGVGSHARQVDQAAGDWVTMRSFSQLFMRAEGFKVAKSKFVHVRDD